MKASVRSPESGGAIELRLEGITPSGGPSGAVSARPDPSPAELLAASLASCTATTIELYARRKGWEVEEVEVDVDYNPAQRGSPARCTIVVRLPEHLPPERRERLMQVAATSQVHRTLEGEIVFDEQVELTPEAKAGHPERPFGRRRRRGALLNGLLGALHRPSA